MSCTVKVIADSVSAVDGKRLTTFQLRYWRAIHSEFMTHRVFSRNASSSRAIPVAKIIEQVRKDIAGPIRFMKNKPGMQATEVCSPEEEKAAREIWTLTGFETARMAQQLVDLNIHKQFANRMLEPWQYISVVVTATEWDNFFLLRDHEDAQPEIRELAVVMKETMAESTPQKLIEGQWHLPYVSDEERQDAFRNKNLFEAKCVYSELAKLSVARCARVSYLTHDGKIPDKRADLELFDRLMGGVPWHASPTEHQAFVDRVPRNWPVSNLKGTWIQFRKVLEWNTEFAEEVDESMEEESNL